MPKRGILTTEILVWAIQKISRAKKVACSNQDILRFKPLCKKIESSPESLAHKKIGSKFTKKQRTAHIQLLFAGYFPCYKSHNF